MKEEFIIKDISDWAVLAKRLLLIAKPKKTATIITLTGDLGVGKTTFVQKLALELGITEVVTSPTFTIMKWYKPGADSMFLNFVHMDAYRIDDIKELAPLRFSEILNQPNTLVCIEWAEKIKDALPKDSVSLTINHTKGEEREVKISL